MALGAAVGGPLATAAVLLHMLGHGLVKAAMFVVAGRILAAEGSARIADVTRPARPPPGPGPAPAGRHRRPARVPPVRAVLHRGRDRRRRVAGRARLGHGTRPAAAPGRVRRPRPARVGHDPRRADRCRARPRGPARRARPPTDPALSRAQCGRPSPWPGAVRHRCSWPWGQRRPGVPGRPPGGRCSARRPQSWQVPDEPAAPHPDRDAWAAIGCPSVAGACSTTAGAWPWSPPTTTPTGCASSTASCARSGNATSSPSRSPATTPGSPPWPTPRSPPAGSNARSATCTASARKAIRCPNGWSGTATGPPATTRCATTPTPPPGSAPTSTPTRSSPSRATACTRSPSDRSTPASSNPGTSGSPWSARPSCRSRPACGSCTAASRSCSRAARPPQGIELAERISGDTAVGHALAYTLAVEDALGIDVDDRARATRALLLEAERLYNHVNDLGAIANDVGYGIAHAHTQRLRETLLRHNKALTGHRLLRGGITHRRRPPAHRAGPRPAARRSPTRSPRSWPSPWPTAWSPTGSPEPPR